jgi:hypothetical protein
VDSLAADAAPTPKILENLVAAGLVSHEMIGDPARLGTETEALAALCARIAGPVYRLGAFHYAFRAEAGDLDGRLAGLAPGEWAPALESALAGDLGEAAVWVSPVDLAAGAEAALDATEILFLEAGGAAVQAGLAEMPGLGAVIHAGLAARGAEIAAKATAAAIAETATAVCAETLRGEGAVAAAIAERIAALEAGLAATLETAVHHAVVEATTGALAATGASEAVLDRLAGTLGALADRLAEQAARQDALASGMVALEAGLARLAAAEAARGPALADLEARLGLTLAEFLAQVVPGQGVPVQEAPVRAGQVQSTRAQTTRAQSTQIQNGQIQNGQIQNAQSRVVDTGREVAKEVARDIVREAAPRRQPVAQLG